MKLPPNDILAEESILASVLVDSDSMSEIDIQPAHFYKPANVVIFECMLFLAKNGTQIDIVSLSDALKTLNNLKKAGGVAYLSRLIDSCPISPNLEHHCNIIREKHDLRQLIKISATITNKSYEQTESSVDIFEASQKEFLEIGTKTTVVTSVADAIQGVFSGLEELKGNIGSISGIPTGFRDLDEHTSGLQNSDLILLGARPGMGKTSLMLNMIKRAAVNCYPVLIFSLEMSKESLIHRLLSDLSSTNLMNFKNGNFEDREWDKLDKASSRISEMNIHIDDRSGLSVSEILSTSRKMKMKHNIQAIYIDYIQLIKGWVKEGQASKVEISWSLKMLAKSLNVPVVALSQLNRSLESRQNDKRPVVSDLRDSGALEQDADIIMFLYRDEVYNKESSHKGKAEIIIRKNRQGSIGTIEVGFIPEYTRFYNLEQY